MCGIVGYLGPRDALPIILDGLSKLEYRGYDSAGVALYQAGEVVVQRAVGKIGILKDQVKGLSRAIPASLGIGHTRWATHGKPSELNAHPHTAGRVSLIHNGIIENYLSLRKELEAKGRVFKSDTDTEIVAHLLDNFLERGLAPFEALKSTCKEIRGSYAFVAFDTQSPDRLLVAKNSTPIVIGLKAREVFIASDIPALLEHTRDIVILEDGDIAEIYVDRMNIVNDGRSVIRKTQTITWDPITAQKGGYKHYMLKEIGEQPRAVADTLLGRINQPQSTVELSELKFTSAELKAINRVVFVACGTAWHAALIGKIFVESFCQIPCEVDYASEFRYRSPVLDKNTLVVAVSQSGETADTISAIELAQKSSPTMAVCNVLGSTISRKVENVLYTHAGPEISVASTKAFTTQLAALYLFGLYLAGARNKLSDLKVMDELLAKAIEIPQQMEEVLRLDPYIKQVASDFCRARDFLYLGRGVGFPVALEGALKLKEISYIHAEGYPAGEMKHGPIALIDESVPVVVILTRNDVLFEKTVSNLREVESRGGKIIVVTDIEDLSDLESMCSAIIRVPYSNSYLSPLLVTIPLQLLAYHIAVLNGTDVDQPRNLAKSVTVE